jgi:hypothetical protein
MLNHHDRVGTWRDWRSGHNLPSVSLGKRSGWSIAGAGCARKFQKFVLRGFRCSAGETVACGAREGRLVAVGVKRLGKDASNGQPEFDAFDAGSQAASLGRMR